MIHRPFASLLLATLACGPSAPADDPSANAVTVPIEATPAEPHAATDHPSPEPTGPQPKPEPPSTAEDDAEAREQFTRGMHAYRAGDYATARAHFDVAYRLSHKAPLLYNLIQVANKQGDRAGACSYYRELEQRATSDPRTAKVLQRTRNPCPQP